MSAEPDTQSTTATRHGMIIAGREVDAVDGATLPVTNPATGEVLAEVAAAGREDIDIAVRAAREAFDSGVWSQMPINERALILNRYADRIDDRIEDLFELETLNNGRPVTETRAQIARLPQWYRYNAALLLAQRTAVVPMPGPYHSYTSRFPLGVVAILSSFNHPLMIGSKALAPALATGNSVVLKPSEQTPLTSLILGEIALEAGIPPGVLNVVNGLGPIAGAALAEHPDVAKITFTGGTGPGRQVAAAAAARFASATLELGGKSPVLVFGDADLDATARGTAFGAFIGAGQTCIAGTRILVQRDIHDDFVAGLVGVAEQITIGDPRDPATQLGPVISSVSGERIMGHIEAARSAGATIATGGERVSVPGCEAGYFLAPTVVTGVTNDDPIARQELFGPVTVVIPFADEADAIAQANDSPFGLGSSIWTSNVARAHRVADRLTQGIVWVNDHHRLDPSSPWGGVRDSGHGREGGWESFEAFTHVRAVTIRTAEEPVDWYGGGSTGRLN